ncbi:RNA polymerase sigma factor [Hymenobacter terricola]|uniref:RNA polymerase sigma factor n=1 Tax=Hymenobacter terricola TaxID=2819236 RepID=UPI001B30069C|nr:RNA polymerase sigma factor [Hymenobacter terricola]
MLASEDDLVLRLLARDEKAMAQFYQQYRPALLAAILRIVRNRQSAEDVLQEGMVKVWFAIASYDATHGRLFTWAARICCNTAIDHIRTGRFRQTARTASLEDTAVMQYAAPTDFRPEHIGVPDLLLGLRPEYRQVMDLMYLQGFTQVEAATEMNVPLGTVKTWVGRARHLLGRLPL